MTHDLRCPLCNELLIVHSRGPGPDPITVRCADCHISSPWAETGKQAVEKMRREYAHMKEPS